jgi:hypothetical protein
LLVVITMLVLFAVVALAFVYFASSEATASRHTREAQTAFRPDLDPELALSYVLGKLLYPSPDDATGVYNALRGHELVRLMYDYDDSNFNVLPFNGAGRAHTGNAPNMYPYGNPYNLDDFYLPSYVYYPGDGFLRDPGRKGSRPGLPAAGDNRGTYIGGANVSYTYPDLNNMFLAAVNAKGEMLIPSFHRPGSKQGAGFNWAVNPNTGQLQYYTLDDQTNPNWTNQQGKYMILRPRPQENPGFPYPADGGGDVKNIEGILGIPVPGKPGLYYNNDSIWMDIGFPVLTGPDGTKYKPLFAFAIVDLDGKANLNVHGNVRGRDNNGNIIHVSNQSWVNTEVSLARAMTTPGGQWQNIFVGNAGAPGVIPRYGPDKQPGKNLNGPGGSGEVPFVTAPSQVDYDATMAPNYLAAQPFLLPGMPGNTNTLFYPYPFYPPQTFTNGDAYERTNHPLKFNFFFPGALGADDRVFAVREMEALWRFGGTGSPAQNSDLFNLCPIDFANPRTRWLLATHSFDLSAPGAVPWLYTPLNNPNPYQMAANAIYPTAPALGSPPAPWATVPGTAIVPGVPLPAGTNITLSNNGEFDPTADPTLLKRRSVAALAALGRVNINRSVGSTPLQLPNYPAPGPDGRITDLASFNTAQTARQVLAQDLFSRLCWVTTGNVLPQDPNALKLYLQTLATTNATQYNALRWLAQLAVNIVDYRDSDDYSTPFNWDPNDTTGTAGGWVFGVEPSRAMLNEAYVEIDNVAADLLAGLPVPANYQVNFWAELHNPYTADPNRPDPVQPNNAAYNGAVRLRMPQDSNGNAPYATYQLILTQTTPAVHTQLVGTPANTQGNVTYPAGLGNTAQVLLPPAGKVDSDVIMPCAGAYNGVNAGNQGFYVLGPPSKFPGNNPNAPQATVQLPTMTYTVPAANVILNAANPQAGLPQFTLALQRLACPTLPPQPNPGAPAYNPYITVDYLEYIPSYNGLLNVGGKAATPNYANMYAWGRKQPFAAFSDITTDPNGNYVQAADSQVVRQTPDSANNAPAIQPYNNMPQNTFFRQNGVGPNAPGNPSPYGAAETLTLPFDWLTHLDRQLVSPMELLFVSGVAPHRVTQLFMSGGIAPNATQPFSHLAPWLDPNARIYRFLEYVETASKADGVVTGGRRPGQTVSTRSGTRKSSTPCSTPTAPPSSTTTARATRR